MLNMARTWGRIAETAGRSIAQAVSKVSYTIVRWWRDEEALTTVEYALLIALIVIVGAAGWDRFGETLANSADEPIAVLDSTSEVRPQ